MMQTTTTDYRSLVRQLPADSVLLLHGVSWNDYEDLLKEIGEAPGLRISYSQGTLQVMTISHRHEKYSRLIERLVDRLSVHLQTKTLSFGSATMKKHEKGSEPDCCFYVGNAHLIGSKEEIDFRIDAPPDIVVEIDIHHDSRTKFSIYAELGVPEIWQYDENSLNIWHLKEGSYSRSTSLAFPVLRAEKLTEFLRLGRSEDQYEALLAFDRWLQNKSAE